MALVVTFVAFWPAIWVLGPAEVLGRVIEFTRETGGQPHEQGTFFWGQQTADPGPFFYPVALAYRLGPVTMLGLVALALGWRLLGPGARMAALGLLAYALGFLLMMTLGAKKLDRYVLPMVPAFGVLAAVGLAGGLRWLRGALPSATALRSTATAGALVVVLAAWPAVTHAPYYLAYYSPLLGGGATAQRTVMIGNGEGLDQVARWLNARPNAADLWVVSHSFDILQALLVGSGEPLRDRVPSNADYVVLYRFQAQIGHSPRVLEEYLNRRTPDFVATIDGVEYAWVFRGPKQLAGPSAAGPAPVRPDRVAPDPVAPAAVVAMHVRRRLPRADSTGEARRALGHVLRMPGTDTAQSAAWNAGPRAGGPEPASQCHLERSEGSHNDERMYGCEILRLRSQARSAQDDRGGGARGVYPERGERAQDDRDAAQTRGIRTERGEWAARGGSLALTQPGRTRSGATSSRPPLPPAGAGEQAEAPS